jgi:DnaJ-class molecular chaperone
VSRTTKAGQELLQAAAEAIAIAKGEAPKDSYRIHIPTKPCTFCLGTGLKSLNDRHNPNSIDCPGCNGTGEAPEVKP